MNTQSNKLEKEFDEAFGGYEWWKTSTRNEFLSVASELVNHLGATPLYAFSVIKKIQNATAEEYGN